MCRDQVAVAEIRRDGSSIVSIFTMKGATRSPSPCDGALLIPTAGVGRAGSSTERPPLLRGEGRMPFGIANGRLWQISNRKSEII